MEFEVAVAKIEKYATGESGDTVELVERPHGGVSVVLVDGQRSGKSAKVISNLVARKAISLLAEGVRDGAAARAAHDYLRTHRRGQVSAEMVILSADLETGTVVVSRNTQAPVLIHQESEWQLLDTATSAVGVYARTRPEITEIPLRPDLIVIATSDGVWSAGSLRGGRMDLLEVVQRLPLSFGAKDFADNLLAQAMQHEQSRPSDDLTVVAFCVRVREGDGARRLHMSFPIPPRIYNTWDRP